MTYLAIRYPLTTVCKVCFKTLNRRKPNRHKDIGTCIGNLRKESKHWFKMYFHLWRNVEAKYGKVEADTLANMPKGWSPN